ncbi:protein MIZU-KUSSEI 1-like [Musa acuminata AAA Group]|uniref:protein MIZU-KUSSEI 1-like n=1 Tax=Musa acuminata AAA Group TaxID=214697 RepID=UPI0031CDF864
MRTMMDLGSQSGLHIIDTSIAVDCTRDVRLRRTLRSLVQHMVPCCVFPPSDASHDFVDTRSTHGTGSSTTTIVTGTFFCYRRGRVSFCLHDEPSRNSPILLLDFTIPTAYLAKEMQLGVLRIALECDRSRPRSSMPMALFSVPSWSMYCNGRKVGYAVRRQMSEDEAAIFKLMQSVSVGAGVVPRETKSGSGDLLYLRASFERVIGSVDSESFHMINPIGSTGQQLSIFLLRT